MGYKYKVIMKKFIGTKVIMAEPMTMVEAQKVLGREIKPTTVEGDGYLVEYEDGYKSWSPKSVFEKAYQVSETPLDRMLIEQNELEDRISKLHVFVYSDKFQGLDKVTQAMLVSQLQTMRDYDNSLCMRSTKMESGEGGYNGFPFGVAITLLTAGFCVRRAGWNGKGLFVCKQIPAHITGDIIPNMQSLPQSAKDILMSRENPHIDYTNQMLIINPDGRADSWVPSSSDVFAEDWEVVTD